MSSTHKKQRMFLSSDAIAMIRNAFSITAANVTLCTQNLNIISIIFCPNFDPEYKQSLRAGPFVLADASKITLNLVVFCPPYVLHDGTGSVSALLASLLVT